jgi:hypothetical protein
MIYLACPYSHPDPAVREARFRAVCAATAALVRGGHVVFAPVVHCHPLVAYGLPPDWASWERADAMFLAACRELVVLTLGGWEESVGVRAEIALAVEAGKPVRFLDPKAASGNQIHNLALGPPRRVGDVSPTFANGATEAVG